MTDQDNASDGVNDEPNPDGELEIPKRGSERSAGRTQDEAADQARKVEAQADLAGGGSNRGSELGGNEDLDQAPGGGGNNGAGPA